MKKLMQGSMFVLLVVGTTACAEGSGGEGATTGATSRIEARAATGTTTGATSAASDTATKARTP
ncbi:MAG: hypothetical protein M3303_14615 [Gemmatimonadota bacterium]|nr:hypothetical protein [Gemmatimonadota bacterium]